MRNYKSYRTKITELFASFLAEEIDIDSLRTTLKAVERNLKQGVMRTQKTLWFKFFEGDTLATDVNDIISCLYSRTKNEPYIREQLRIAIENPKGLRIHYS